MATSLTPPSARTSFLIVLGILGMMALPSALTLHTARVPPIVNPSATNPSPYGYTVSLLLFIVPILVIGIWWAPKEGVHISKKSFARTIAILFPLGVALDFFFARSFFMFPNANATLHIKAPALGGGVPIEEYIFYFTGFMAVLLIYIWLDEYWLSAYSIPVDDETRTSFDRLLRFHPRSLILAVVLIAGAILFRRFFVAAPGFPGYFIVLVAGALGPSAALLPSALPVINWRAFGLTFFVILLISLLWEATLGVPYGWWGFQQAHMLGIYITAWSRLPIEEVFIWIAVTFATTIVYEIVRRWQSSGKPARHAFLGVPPSARVSSKTP